MVVIRMARGGSKKRPFYQIVVADKRAARDGRHIQKIGFFNPLARGQEESFRIDLDSYNAWVAKGAQPTDRIAQLVKQAQQ
ncbi:30S ribosomal protein S16 [Moraxella sp. VT-16-12]|uniref:30S ribosomal protein S16 n=1 Tax=Moraxella sp. VT-16-12 TaxID=2014877 RepID=UPI000B7D2660|nr:30S ribosomal protein S16 [Moraxella sp. VT-16-12]TWV81079.1 30S ribosomal protein S16 [Moraxella sp. VT-16-12]